MASCALTGGRRRKGGKSNRRRRSSKANKSLLGSVNSAGNSVFHTARRFGNRSLNYARSIRRRTLGWQ